MPVRKPAIPTLQLILLVDDNANGLKARKKVLEELGFEIVTASNGVDALAHFEPAKFHVIVTDYKMPRMDGLELIAQPAPAGTGRTHCSDLRLRRYAGSQRRKHEGRCGDSEERE